MPVTSLDVSRALVKEARERQANPGELWGVSWGIRTLDEMTGGIQQEEMSVLGAVPSVGKTALMGQIAVHRAQWAREHEDGKVIRVVLTEMNAKAVQARLAFYLDAIEVKRLREEDPSRILRALTMRRLKTGDFSDEELKRFKRAAAELAELPIEWDDEPTSPEATRRWIENDGRCVWFGVDYLQKHPTGRTDLSGEDTKGAIMLSHAFQKIAQKVCPGLVLSSLNREIWKRPDHRPQMSDLFGAAGIEHDASVIMFLHRPDIFEDKTDEDRSKEQFAQLIVAKNRQGEQGVVKLLFSPKNWAFVDITGKEE